MATYEKTGDTVTTEAAADNYNLNMQGGGQALQVTVKVETSEGPKSARQQLSSSSLTTEQKTNLLEYLGILRSDGLTALGFSEQ